MSVQNAEQITRSAKSNLAFAFAGLPRDKKRDLTVFYAFCRVIDDIADEIGPEPEQKNKDLDHWKSLVSESPHFPAQPGLEQEVQELLVNPDIDRDAMLGIIEGCRSDILPSRFQTIDDLLQYTYKVASCVGIVSATLFGASKEAREYAIALGHALQLTNILRDVGEDWTKEQRIYLPLADMAACGYSDKDLENSVRNEAFFDLMALESSRAEKFYAEAHRLYNALSYKDRRALAPALAMDLIYHDILNKMVSGKFQIFDTRYKLSKWRKIRHLISAVFLSRRKKSTL